PRKPIMEFMTERSTLLKHITALMLTLGSTAVIAQVDTPTGADWHCPSGYEIKAGLNTDFPHAGQLRAFVVYPPENASGPVPVWVPLTGSVESTTANLTVARSGANALLADE